MAINNQCLIGNPVDSECHYNFDGGILNDYCQVETSRRDHDKTCSSLAAQLLAYRIRDRRASKSSIPEVVVQTTTRSPIRMDTYEKHSQETLVRIWHIQCTIIVTLIAIAVARIGRHKYISAKGGCKLWWPSIFLLEFVVISVPVVMSVNVLNQFVEYVIAFAALLLLLLLWQTQCLQKASQREFEFGSRPALFTLLRSTINLLTALCILAIDFESFPKKFRKTRRYGAGLMDVGIGLFVFSMAVVSSRPKRLSDVRKSIFPVSCMLVLGLARTLVIRAIDYHQDEHEYGVHLNAFFTLGLTKLFGTLLLYCIKRDGQALPLGVAILFVHEMLLQAGLSSFVIDPELERTNFMLANREGLCSLPGFIALYILSQYLGKWLKAKDVLNCQEIMLKLKHLMYVSVALWLIVILCTVCIGIARVTCNLGYVTWMLAISVTMCALYLFTFDIVLDTLWPVKRYSDLSITLEAEETPPTATDKSLHSARDDVVLTKIPFIIESINFNGLLYFLLGNVLTGSVNIFLNTDEKTDSESVCILLGYMLTTTGVASLLYRFNIRIA